jgi:uncharacterized OB-fold protein
VTYPAAAGASTPSRRLPIVDDPASAPFWRAARRHVLMAQRCLQCGDTRYPQLEICPNCWSVEQEWQEVAPTGELWSYVVYHRALDPSTRDDVPYVVGRVVTDDGPIFTVRLDVEPGQAVVGMRVAATWHDVTDDVTLLRFAPA